MKSFALASGSSGNCFFVENFVGKKILVDCGLSFSKTKEILKARNIDIFSLDAIFITHEHSDHCTGINIFLKEVDCDFYMSKGTKKALNLDFEKIKIVKEHDVVNMDDMRIFVLSKPHDAKEALSFVFESEGKKIGFFTDLGYVTDEIKHILKSLDVVYFEANYCEDYVKGKNFNVNYLNRLMSEKGHLGLAETCEVLPLVCKEEQRIVLAHISENTNTYENVYIKVKKAFENIGKFPDIMVSFQGEPSDWIE